ncbi:flagellar biosynthesis protein FlhB [Lignipirellula cremea]|uniref:Flagellar biosynthetic protein FlhB n=1 Tax=Lignipirellula cremea TaxID=2528010 RepID=A0A518E0L5_9BACT|nr:flagellar biosynthesis protein FlhB [Lignipirellula cremea]QDU97601.1 Flagellar biosynthetic protein FlhB [Lignipirellula cremea]
MADDSGDKTHEATDHRREQAREQGQIPKSQDLSSAVLLAGALMVFYWWGLGIFEFIGRLMQQQLGGDAMLTVSPELAVSLFRAVLIDLAWALLPLLLGLFLLAIIVQVGQVGFLFLPQKLQFNMKHINPMEGAKRLFSLTNVVRFGFGLFKVTLIAITAVVSLVTQWPTILALSDTGVGQIATFLASLIFWTCVRIAGLLLVLAVAEYAFQRWKHEQDLRMSTQEMRDELKNQQGDPQMIARRRAVQRQLVMNRLSGIVPEADVVVTNPTELAIALKYDYDTMPAPVVVAKGAGVLAARIRRLALENGVPIVERKELARALYAEVEVNRPVPEQRFAAVAEVLRYVYQLQGKTIPGINRS